MREDRDLTPDERRIARAQRHVEHWEQREPDDSIRAEVIAAQLERAQRVLENLQTPPDDRVEPMPEEPDEAAQELEELNARREAAGLPPLE